jgi:hypothetical protein
MAKYYATLVGPLLDIYYPLPFEDENKNRIALSSSRLARLWCSVCNDFEVDEMVKNFGGIKLNDSYISRLDYDWDLVNNS